MEHAIRSHIRKHADEDPVLYRKLSERLSDILKNLGEQWNELIAQLQKIIDELRTGQAGSAIRRAICPNIARPSCARCWTWCGTGQRATPAELLRLKDVTVELVDLLVQELQATAGSGVRVNARHKKT
jgi:type I restriction enzyme R subunit